MNMAVIVINSTVIFLDLTVTYYPVAIKVMYGTIRKNYFFYNRGGGG
jgi:hypothetical protein